MSLPKSWQLSRRTLLRGVMGSTTLSIGLPWLEAMTLADQAPGKAPKPQGADQAAVIANTGAAAVDHAPTRLACLFFPNGVWQKSWIPKAKGTDYEMPFSLTPLAAHRRRLLVVSGLDKANSRKGDGHYAKTANFLTGGPVIKTTGRDLGVGGVSLDQLVASKVGHLTPLPSLELGIDAVISGIDSNVGYTRLYGSYISWRSASIPVAREINPRFVYERLFGTGPKTGPAKTGLAKSAPADPARADRQRPLLDAVLADAKDLRGRLGRDDQYKLDEYLDALRGVERRAAFAEQPDPRRWAPPNHPEHVAVPDAAIPADYRQHVRLMLDLMVLAFQIDATRVTSFMFANDVSGRNFSFVDGVRAGHHDLSHHSNDPAKIEQYQRINRWHTGELAYLLDRLSAIPEGPSSTLADSVLVMMGSSMSDGNSHNPNNLPILVAGGAGRQAWPSGRHIASPANTPLCNLYTSLLRRLGIAAEQFGDATGPLAELEAAAS